MKTFATFFFIIFLVLFYACTEKETFSLPKSEYTILPFSQNDYYIFENVKETTLSDKELIEIEFLFQKMATELNSGQARALAKHNEENPENQWKKTGFELKTEGYKRQYLPVLNAKGEKEVWINFFCRHFEDLPWKTSTFTVMDGGNCYYNFKINLAIKEIYDLRINGSA